MKTPIPAILFALIAIAARAATLNVAADAYVSSNYAALNFGNSPTLNIGNGNAALIALDLSSLPAGLTAANIQKATLTVYVSAAPFTGALDISQVTGSWPESGVTYNNQPSANAPFVKAVPVAASGTYVTFDITGVFTLWATGVAPNYGVEIAASASQPGTMVDLDSKESTSTSHVAFGSITLVSIGPAGPAGPQGQTGLAGPPGTGGPPGTRGAQGAQGPPGLNWRGIWNAAAVYAPNDVAFYAGSSWEALAPPGSQPSPNENITPGTNANFWTVLVAGGATGPQGGPGRAGAQGPTGPPGTTGLAGAAGATGPPGFNWRGEWTAGAKYVVQDAVMYGGSAWVAVQPSAGHQPSPSASVWAILTAAGTAGAPPTLPAAQGCPSGTYIMGFDKQGNVNCTSHITLCPVGAYVITIYSIDDGGLQVWPSGKYSTTDSTGCGAIITAPIVPGDVETTFATNQDCTIDHSGNTVPCPGWNSPTPVLGHNFCIMEAAIPNCGSLAAIARLDGTFPACSSALTAGGNQSSATVIITCFPQN